MQVHTVQASEAACLNNNIIGRRQLVALKQTQKEQSRLEKLFLQQQREIRNLQREQGIIKSGAKCCTTIIIFQHHNNAFTLTTSDLLVTKEHAERLQHRLEDQLSKSEFQPVLNNALPVMLTFIHGNQ